MNDPTVFIISGLLIAILSGLIGKYIGHIHKVSCSTCHERRKSCQELLGEKMDNLASKVDDVKRAVDKLKSVK